MKFVEIVDLEQFLAKTLNSETKFATIHGDHMWAFGISDDSVFIYKTESPEYIYNEYGLDGCGCEEDYEVEKLKNCGFTIFTLYSTVIQLYTTYEKYYNIAIGYWKYPFVQITDAQYPETLESIVMDSFIHENFERINRVQDLDDWKELVICLIDNITEMFNIEKEYAGDFIEKIKEINERVELSIEKELWGFENTEIERYAWNFLNELYGQTQDNRWDFEIRNKTDFNKKHPVLLIDRKTYAFDVENKTVILLK